MSTRLIEFHVFNFFELRDRRIKYVKSIRLRGSSIMQTFYCFHNRLFELETSKNKKNVCY